MQFDLNEVPFSRFGSYMALNIFRAEDGSPLLQLRTMHGIGGARDIFQVVPLRDGAPAAYETVVTPSRLRLKVEGGGEIEFCFAEPDVLRVRGRGTSLRLLTRDDAGYIFRAGENQWHLNATRTRMQHLLTGLRGRIHPVDPMDSPRLLRIRVRQPSKQPRGRPGVVVHFGPDADGCFEGAIEEMRTTPARDGLSDSFEQCAAAVRSEWSEWLETTPEMPERYAAAAELAMYVNWASVVAPSGMCRRPTMLMSKNVMNACWSWDHCFNAVALSYRNPDLAWDQLMVPFDHQDRYGALPDSVAAPGCGWGFCKPPIHGWALSKLMANPVLARTERLEDIYGPLCRWTDWWLNHRDYDGDGLPEYHHGNDSGWDNSTAFACGFPAAAPDLAGYLIVQMHVLGDVADRLERAEEAECWRRRAEEMSERLMDVLWHGHEFVTRQAFTGDCAREGDSLLNQMAIAAGKWLPAEARDAIAETVRPDGRFVTEYGPATESPRSPLYVPKGYWQGPIWGSETTLLVDGLARAGYREQAKEIARRYCDMCVSCGTFAENYDALTGRPQCDTAYTWGSSAYLILAHELLPDQ